MTRPDAGRRVEPREEACANGRETGKQAWRKNTDVRISEPLAGVGCDAAVDEAHVTERVERRIVDEHQVGVGLAGGQPRRGRRQRGVIEIGHDVAADDDERIRAQQRQRTHDAAERLERSLGTVALARVRQRDAEVLAVAERAFECVGQVRHVDDHFTHPGARQPLDLPLDQAPSTSLQQRLRRVVRQRAHPLAPPRRQYQRSHFA